MARSYVGRFGYSPLPIVAAVFIFLDSLGLVFLPHLEHLPLPYLPEARSAYSLVDRKDIVYLHHVFAHVLVHGLFFWGMLFLRVFVARWLMLRKGSLSEVCTLRRKATLALSVILLFLGVFFYFKYFFQGPGLILLTNYRIFYSLPAEAVQARSLAASQVEFGQGAYGASLAAYLVWPFFAALAVIMLGRHKLFQLFVIGVTFLMSVAYALQTYQKAPIAYCVLLYGGMLLVISHGERLSEWASSFRGQKVIGRFTSLAILLGFVGGTALYIFNFGLSFWQAIVATLGRVFLVPANTEAYWFLVYPHKEAFLGLPWVLNTNMEIIKHTAFLATGDLFSANASFIAVGWSGFGVSGVLMSALVVVGYLVYAEIMWGSLCPKGRLLAIAFLLGSIFFLLSGTLFDWLSKGGLGIVLLLISSSRRVLNFRGTGGVK